MDQLLGRYDFRTIEDYNVEELRKKIDENSKALEESIKELRESNRRILAQVK